jgi:glycosyltransferase involved in cell wall biosynthesis
VWHIRDVMRGRRRFFPVVDALGACVPDAIVANSDYTAAQFSRCRSRVTRIYNGLVLDDYSPATDAERAEFKRRWSIPIERRLVGILGVLTPLKGHRVFLDAAKEILAARPEAHFVVVGDEIYDTAGHRGYRKSLEDYARALGIAERVTFTGFLDHVERVLPCLDVLVQASVEPESFGRVVVEAQASGVPVVASRIGAIPEIIRDGSLGTLVRPGASDDIARAVRRYLESDELHRRTADAARVYAIDHFSVRSVIDELSQLYDRILKEETKRV